MKTSTQAGKLKNALTHVSLVTTKQSNLSALEGVYFEVKGTGGVLRATNLNVGVEARFAAAVEQEGMCLVDPQILLGVVSALDGDAKRIDLIEDIDMKGLMIPVKNVQTLVRILGDEEGDVSVTFSNSQMSFETKNRYCVTRLVDGNYPAYEQIIPTEFGTTVTLLKNDLVGALKTLNIFTDTFHQIDITIDPHEKTVTMTSQHPERGQHTTNLEAVIEGGDLHVRCNAKYVQDCLGSIGTDSVQLKFTVSNKPFIITPVGDTSFQYLVMPLNR
jgi:DNA polymerase III sliding clamp (beta) subunit (PCNA family)